MNFLVGLQNGICQAFGLPLRDPEYDKPAAVPICVRFREGFQIFHQPLRGGNMISSHQNIPGRFIPPERADIFLLSPETRRGESSLTAAVTRSPSISASSDHDFGLNLYGFYLQLPVTVLLTASPPEVAEYSFFLQLCCNRFHLLLIFWAWRASCADWRLRRLHIP